MRMSLAGRSKDNKHKLSGRADIFEVQQVKNRNGMGARPKKPSSETLKVKSLPGRDKKVNSSTKMAQN